MIPNLILNLLESYHARHWGWPASSLIRYGLPGPFVSFSVLVRYALLLILQSARLKEGKAITRNKLGSQDRNELRAVDGISHRSWSLSMVGPCGSSRNNLSSHALVASYTFQLRCHHRLNPCKNASRPFMAPQHGVPVPAAKAQTPGCIGFCVSSFTEHVSTRHTLSILTRLDAKLPFSTPKLICLGPQHSVSESDIVLRLLSDNVTSQEL